ncbi:Annexin A7 [Cricetulus griseus]|uniref:Annexin n=1 Tax=Cricetulus griseus TaxID=10029 RepID=G3IC49_CRIGR|nr:Annexin A7 [Cricetulus griseus]
MCQGNRDENQSANHQMTLDESQHLYQAGAGTDDSMLVRIVVTRSEIDLDQIKQIFTQMHQKTLSTMIASDKNGDYRKLLLAIVGL